MRSRNPKRHYLLILPAIIFVSLFCSCRPIINDEEPDNEKESQGQDYTFNTSITSEDEDSTIIQVEENPNEDNFHNLPEGFDTLYSMKEDGILFPVWFDNKCGYINSDGQPVTYFNYYECRDFSDGVAIVRVDNNLSGVEDWGTHYNGIDQDGTTLFTVETYSIGEYSDGLAFIEDQTSNLWGFINTSGEMVIQPEYTRTSSFSEGYAVVEKEDGWKGIIDKQGIVISDEVFCNYGKYSDGILILTCYDNSIEGYSNFMDYEGNIVGSHSGKMEEFSEGFAVAKREGWMGYGYIDKTGEFVIDPEFSRAESFHEGFAAVLEGNNWSYIDNNGNYINSEKYSYAGNFCEGYAWVRSLQSNTNWDSGFIDRTGNLIATFNIVGSGFVNGLAIINNRNLDINNPLVSIIDATGAIVFETQDFNTCEFNHVGLFNCVLNSNEEEVIMNRDWEIIYPFDYDS